MADNNDAERGTANDNGKMSSKSSDISIEEIGAEEATIEKEENAEVLLPEETPEEPSKEVVPAVAAPVEKQDEEADEEDDEDEDDDFEDETLYERLVGLIEMFPEGLTDTVNASAKGLVSGTKWAYKATRALTWIACTSAAITMLPVMIETERLGIAEMEKQQQRQILLGPGAAMSGGKDAQANAPLPAALT